MELTNDQTQKYLILLIQLILINIILCNTVFAEENKDIYILFEIGGSYSQEIDGNFKNDIDESIAFGTGIGYRFNNKIRSDIICSYRPYFNDPYSAALKGDIKIFTLIGNIYWDIFEFGRLKPYIGSGIGMSYNKTDAVYSENGTYSELGIIIDGESKTNFSYQLIAGSYVTITTKINMNICYRYLDAGDLEYGTEGQLMGKLFHFFEDKPKGDVKLNEIFIGLSYFF